jgi:hypothetical protein
VETLRSRQFVPAGKRTLKRLEEVEFQTACLWHGEVVRRLQPFVSEEECRIEVEIAMEPNPRRIVERKNNL